MPELDMQVLLLLLNQDQVRIDAYLETGSVMGLKCIDEVHQRSIHG